MSSRRSLARGTALGVIPWLVLSCGYYEQASLPASHNWAFRHEYPEADRLFNAFDFGHAVLYDELVTHPTDTLQRIERDRFQEIVGHLLLHPPSEPLDEEALAPAYVHLVPEAHEMFVWAHMLHRQIYDVWADDHIPIARKDAEIARIVRYYRSRPDLAFSSKPKRMSLMTDFPFSVAFHRGHPKYNGLLWSYHWLQVVLYDALISGDTPHTRRANVDSAVAGFFRLLDDPPAHMPTVMPMTGSVAPMFAARYPEAAIIFDNLHAFHDVVADVLASPTVPKARKRATILTAAALYRDSTSDVISVAEWQAMAAMMPAGEMGGIAFRASHE
jgi:hypothetical protein